MIYPTESLVEYKEKMYTDGREKEFQESETLRRRLIRELSLVECNLLLRNGRPDALVAARRRQILTGY